MTRWTDPATRRHLRRLFPVVLGGRTLVLLLAQFAFLFSTLLITLATGEAPGATLKSTVIYPAMVLVVLCTADIVPALRRNGEMELAVTLADPVGFVLTRFTPAVLVAAAQILAVSAGLAFIVGPLAAAIACAAAFIPFAYSIVASLYWNLRLQGAASVFAASALTCVPAVIWIGAAQLVRESENRETMTALDIARSCLLCQAGVLMGACCLGALALRRFRAADRLLRDAA